MKAPNLQESQISEAQVALSPSTLLIHLQIVI